MRAIAREFRKPKRLAVSDYSGLIVNAVQINCENCDLISRRQLHQFLDHCLADLFALEKAAGAIVAQIENKNQGERLARLTLAGEI